MSHNAENDARRPGLSVRFGRLALWPWSGSWSWVHRESCDHCHNLYVGPFGVEWTRVIPPGSPARPSPASPDTEGGADRG